MNLESLKYRNLTDYLFFYYYVSERIVKDGKNYLIFDELQIKMYIQVTESMQSEETRERELRPLRIILDNYEKIVLSMDRNYIIL